MSKQRLGFDTTEIAGEILVPGVPALVTPATLFIVKNNEALETRTPSQVLSDIGAAGANITITGTADSSGNVDLSAQPIPLWAKYALYGADGNNSAAFYNGGTRMITGMNPNEAYHFTY